MYFILYTLHFLFIACNSSGFISKREVIHFSSWSRIFHESACIAGDSFVHTVTGNDATSKETLGEDPATGLNDLKTPMCETLRERFLPSSLGRGAMEMETQMPQPCRPDKIHPRGRRGPTGSIGIFSEIGIGQFGRSCNSCGILSPSLGLFYYLQAYTVTCIYHQLLINR